MKTAQRTFLTTDERAELVAAIRQRLNVLRVQVDAITDQQEAKPKRRRLQLMEGLYHRMMSGELHIVGNDE